MPEREPKEQRQILIHEKKIKRIVKELAGRIAHDYEGKDPILVGVLKGAFVFLADLERELYNLGLDFVVDFIAISSYDDEKESSGQPRILKDFENDISGRDVLFVEDIVDTGITQKVLLGIAKARGATSAETVAFMDKPSRRLEPIEAKYIGIVLKGTPWVEGYGLDTEQRGRGNPNVVEVIIH